MVEEVLEMNCYVNLEGMGCPSVEIRVILAAQTGLYEDEIVTITLTPAAGKWRPDI